jgi:membrane-associated phospholipid phosphatase
MKEWLESLIPWGTEVIIWVQSFSNPWLDTVFLFFTQLGYEEFYLFAMPIVFWCIDKQIGATLAYIAMFSAWINSAIKFIFKIPRPNDPRIRVLRPDPLPSFPSGHAQNAVVNWGYLAYRFRNRIFTIVAVFLIAAISLSRIVIGVHFPQDVIAGLLIGAVLLVIFIRSESPVRRWIAGQQVSVQIILAIGVPVLLIFLHPADPEDVYPAKVAVTSMSGLAGFGLGLVMEQAWIRFRVDGEWWRRGLRFLLGLTIVAILYIGPGSLLPEGMAYGLETALRFVRYALVGWSVSFLCPWLFVKLRLAEQAEA